VQVDSTRPTLKPTGTKPLKLKYDIPLSNYAFKFNLRCYSKVYELATQQIRDIDTIMVRRCKLNR
jgi:hypothetical protein